MKVVIGPFGHAMPEYSHRHRGPGYDGKAEMVRWFNYWLKDDVDKDDIMDEPDITLFMRTSLNNGSYRYESQWPIARRQIHRMFMTHGKKLLKQTENKEFDSNDVDTLEYQPWIGHEAGDWWGVSDSDQRPFDEHCLVYDSDVIQEPIEIAGFVNVSLQVRKHFMVY